MSKRILIFGASGFVGMHLFKKAKNQGHTILGCCIGALHPIFINVDISDFDAVDKLTKSFKPDWVINTAAISNIDMAEENKELAWLINVVANQHIAKVCRETGSRFMFFSSDAVFKGDALMYNENDSCNPVNYYGFTKSEAEKAIVSELPNAAILRISLVLGFPVETGNSFLVDFLDKLKKGETVSLLTDQIRTPIEVTTLADCCSELVAKNFEGILHLGSTNSLSRYEIGLLFAIKAGFGEALIKPISGNVARKALRHKRGVLNVSKARQILNTPLLTVEGFINKILETNMNL